MLNTTDTRAVTGGWHGEPARRLPSDGGVAGLVAPSSAPEWKSYFRVLHRARVLIAAVTALCLLAAALYALAAPPVYEAQMLIHVEEDSPNASKNILNELSSLFETKKAAIAEMELLRSRMVVTRAVDDLQLYIQAAPRYFPLAGFRIADAAGRGLSQPGIFGWGGYAWGAEAISVARFDVPDSLLERDFVVEASGERRYVLRAPGGQLLLAGSVGDEAAIQTAQGPLRLRVTRLDGRAGARFLLRRVSHLRAVQQLQAALTISEQGKQSGVIELRLQDQSARRASAALEAIGAEYLRQNLNRKQIAADKTLTFLDQQLPVLKKQLAQAEADYNRFRTEHATVNLAEEVRLGLQRAAELRTLSASLKQKRIELLGRYTDQHPVLLALNQQQVANAREREALDQQIKTWPQLEQDEARLARDVKVSTDLYLALLNTAQQLRLLQVGGTGNVRLVDAPVVPERPIRPNRLLVLALAGVSGLFIGGMLAFARQALRAGMEEPSQVEAMLGVGAVHATIPHSRAQARLKQRPLALPLLAHAAPDDAAVATLRAWRAALEYALPHSRNHVVLLAGPTRGVGAAFITLNLALLLASGGKRTLLIDARLRNGTLHHQLHLAEAPGLAEALSGVMPVEQVLRRGVYAQLDVIPAGRPPAAPADLLQHLNCASLLASVGARYDVVLILAPPVLEVADALILGGQAGMLFLVARAGVTAQGELNESIRRLNQAGIAPHGVLFNGAPSER